MSRVRLDDSGKVPPLKVALWRHEWVLCVCEFADIDDRCLGQLIHVGIAHMISNTVLSVRGFVDVKYPPPPD